MLNIIYLFVILYITLVFSCIVDVLILFVKCIVFINCYILVHQVKLNENGECCLDYN